MKDKQSQIQPVLIQGHFIRLDALLKFQGLVGTGGEAKYVIQDGKVLVNGEICTLRGKKLHAEDQITYQGETFVILQNETPS